MMHLFAFSALVEMEPENRVYKKCYQTKTWPCLQRSCFFFFFLHDVEPSLSFPFCFRLLQRSRRTRWTWPPTSSLEWAPCPWPWASLAASEPSMRFDVCWVWWGTDRALTPHAAVQFISLAGGYQRSPHTSFITSQPLRQQRLVGNLIESAH